MAAKFKEVLPYSGVDENTPTGGTGIVVPLKGSNMVILTQGPKLSVKSDSSKVQVQEFNDSKYKDFVSDLPSSIDKDEQASILAKLKDKTWRVFKVSSNELPGLDKAHIHARNASASKVEAMLKVLVVKRRTVKIAIRPVQTKDDSGKVVAFSKGALDIKTMLDQMNRVWVPQANVTFEVTDTSPMLITEGLTANSDWADIRNDKLHDALMKGKVF